MTYLDVIVTILILVVLAVIYQFKKTRARDDTKAFTDFGLPNSGDNGFKCSQVEDLGNNSLQFFGSSVGISIRPGMKLVLPNSQTEPILEVYATDSDQPSLEIPPNTSNAAITINASNSEYQGMVKKILLNYPELILHIRD